MKAFGKVDIFIDSAGVHTEKVGMWTMTPSEFERVMKINIEGAYFSSIAAARYMKDNNIRGIVLDINLNHTIIETVEKNPRITLWSAKSAAVLRYLRKTQPEFSISKEASRLIDEAIAEEYPEIWTLFNHL